MNQALPSFALEIRGLAKNFEQPAVDGLDLRVRTGEFYTLLGLNGAGKTTTLRMVPKLAERRGKPAVRCWVIGGRPNCSSRGRNRAVVITGEIRPYHRPAQSIPHRRIVGIEPDAPFENGKPVLRPSSEDQRHG